MFSRLFIIVFVLSICSILGQITGQPLLFGIVWIAGSAILIKNLSNR